MRPVLRPGDRLLVDHRRAVRAGDLVVARVPGRPAVVKRAVERRTTDLGEPGWWLASEDPERGTDSRTFGPVAEVDVVAVVVMRMWPPGRRRAVPDSRRA